MSNLTKKDLKNGIKFSTKFSGKTIYKINIRDDSKYLTSELVFKSVSILTNQYSIESITDKYLKIWDFNFGETKTFRVKLSEINIIN